MTVNEHVYAPTEAERRMLDEALDELHRDPGSSRPWQAVRQEIWPQQ